MGLDIYLYTRQQAEQNELYNEATEALYAEGPDGKSQRDRMSDEEYKAWRELTGDYASYDHVPSQRYPDHLFERRYLRSSYNGGGFNHAVPEMLGDHGDGTDYPNQRGSLYWIFEPMGREWDGDDGRLTTQDVVKLRAAKVRALEVADALRKSDRLRVMTVGPNMFMAPPTTTDDQALTKYRAEVERGRIEPGSWYSSAEMNVFGGGLEILAAIPGKDAFGVPAVHLIWRQADDGFDSYTQSAEIVAEFIDEAIALIECDGWCRMSWSG